MTDFYYNNEERLLQLQGEILGDEGELWRIITPQNVDVYKFLISMSIERGLHISHKAYMKVKEYAVYADCTIQNRVFFYMYDSYSRDILYFHNFMERASKDPEFLSVYYTYFSKAA